MPVHDARKFINQVSGNQRLRRELNRCKSSKELTALLGEHGFKFDSGEFTEAWSSEVAKSPTRERHDALNELRMWWEMVSRF